MRFLISKLDRTELHKTQKAKYMYWSSDYVSLDFHLMPIDVHEFSITVTPSIWYLTMMMQIPFAFGVSDAKTRVSELRASVPDCLTISEFSFNVSSVQGRKVVASNQTKLKSDNFCWSHINGAFMWSTEQIWKIIIYILEEMLKSNHSYNDK